MACERYFENRPHFEKSQGIKPSRSAEKRLLAAAWTGKATLLLQVSLPHSPLGIRADKFAVQLATSTTDDLATELGCLVSPGSN